MRTVEIDRFGNEAWRLRWDGDRLAHARIRLPTHDELELHPATSEHLLLGPCDAVHRHGEPIAQIAAVSWHAPACIPAVDVPGALPPGAGTAILNLIAVLAQRAGARSLRYRGPYPTSALFTTLASSFRVAGDRDDAEQRFTCEPGFGTRAIVPEVDFVPDPHTWSWPTPRICVQRRREVERIWVDGRAYDRGGEHHVLVRDGDAWSAQLVFATRTWCEVVRVVDDDLPCTPIAEPPPAPTDLVGVALPREMIDVIGEVIARESAPALGPAIAQVLAKGITLADTGLVLARAEPSGTLLHAVLVERALALGSAASLATLARALRPTVVRAAVARLAV